MDSYIYYKLFLVFFLVVINSLFSAVWFFERRQSLLVDAISHSVLPILVLVYLFVQSLSSFSFVFFAVLFSTVVAWLISFLSKFNTKHSQSLIGVFFSGLFALGLLLTNVFARNVHLDADSVLFGALEFSIFENIQMFGFLMPISILKLFFLLSVNVICFYCFRNLFSALSFDQTNLKLHGFNTNLIDFFQLFLLVLNVIFCFEVVGVILTLGLNVIPVLIASYFSYRTSDLLNVSLLVSLITLLIASFLAFSFNLSLGAIFMVLLGVVFLVLSFFRSYFMKL
jgi:manganese/zinc/iron transport system permease protein